jgi:DNA-binding beta-propeller fold protein YncE
VLEYVGALPEKGAEPFRRPVGVAVGRSRVYVADSEAGLVRVFSVWGPEATPIGEGVLRVPTYLAFDGASGTLIVSDRAAGRALRFSPRGEVSGELRPADEATGTAWAPLGLAADAGRIAVTDASVLQRVLLMDATGTVTLEIGTRDATSTGVVGVALDYPNSVDFVGDEIWVGDSNNRRVLVFDSQGGLQRLVRIDGVARGLAALEDPDSGRTLVAVVDALGSEIVLLDAATGEEVARFGGPGSAPGRLAYPNDVAYDPTARRLYVADTGNARVQVWDVRPSESRAPAPLEVVRRAAPARIAGALLAISGMVLVIISLWPQRPHRGAETARMQERP